MTTLRPIFGPGRFRVSEIVYNCDLSRTEAKLIPLGVMVELRAGDWYGLSLQARTRVLDEELVCVGRLARPIVERPFQWLSGEFDRVFDSSSAAEEFTHLSDKHKGSLNFSPSPQSQFEIAPFISREIADGQKAYLRDMLTVRVTKSFWELMERCGHGSAAEVRSEVTELPAAA